MLHFELYVLLLLLFLQVFIAVDLHEQWQYFSWHESLTYPVIALDFFITFSFQFVFIKLLSSKQMIV